MILIPVAATIAAFYLGFHYVMLVHEIARAQYGMNQDKVARVTQVSTFIAAALVILLVVAIWGARP